MREIIEEVLRVEEQASEILRKAREEAGRLRSDSEAQASRILAEATKTGRTMVQEGLEKARNEAEARKKLLIEEAGTSLSSLNDQDSESFERAVQGVLKILCRPAYRKDS
ncbi:MAG: hypothetical protein JW760_01075 [Spirochaetales bacterium]|nr:hypothetical protein [Spirochaetales bacterium]